MKRLLNWPELGWSRSSSIVLVIAVFSVTALLLSVVVGLTTCNRGQSPRAPTSELVADEYDVLSAYLADLFTGQKGKELASQGVIKIVVFNMTSSGEDKHPMDENGQPIPWEKMAESLRKKAPDLQQTTIDAFRKVNTQEALLRRSLHPSINYELVDSAQLQVFFTRSGGSWPAYYKQSLLSGETFGPVV